MAGLEIDLSVYSSEEALLHALRRGEVHACTCLLKQFAGVLYQPALEILGDAQQADVAVQNAMIKACDKFDSFQEQSRLSTWLYRIALNEALMERRRLQSRKAGGSHAPLTAVADQIYDEDPLTNPVQAVISAEVTGQIADALEALPENLRSVLILRGLRGYSTAQTAAELGITESAAKVRLHRARQQLKQIVGEL